MRILITGSTGMIGARLAEKLGKKHTIVEASRAKGVDISNLDSVKKIMKKVDVVIHAAAELDETKGEKEIWKTNVEGTRHLLDAAEENDVQQFIFLSSVGVHGETHSRLDETSPMNPITAYEKSKAEAEKLVWERQEVFPVTIIRPALVMGPNSYWASIFKTVRKGFPLIGKGENAWQMVHVDELVGLIEKTIGNEDAYNAIFLAAENETHSLREVVNMVAEIQGKKHPGSIPKPIGMGIAHVFGIYGTISGKKPLLIPAHVKRLFKHRAYDTQAARKLDWKPAMSTREALEKTFRELTEKGMLAKK